FADDGVITINTGSFVYYSITSDDWRTSTTWSTVGFGSSINAGTYPLPGDAVQIGGGKTVTITAAEACATLTFDQATALANTVSIGSGSLTVSGAVTIPRNGSSNVLDVGAG